MAAVRLDIEVQRNAAYARDFLIEDEEGLPIDLTGVTHEFDIKYHAGDPDPPIATATITPGVTPTEGRVTVEIDGADFAAVDGTHEVVRLAYDWIATQDGYRWPLARGYILLTPGVS
jgi:hypothetical protein